MSRTMQILNTQFCRNSVEINEVRNLSLLCKLHTYTYFHRSKSCLHRRSLHINTECALWILANHSNLITTHFKFFNCTMSFNLPSWSYACIHMYHMQYSSFDMQLLSLEISSLFYISKAQFHLLSQHMLLQTIGISIHDIM